MMETARIDLKGLQKKLVGFSNKVDLWAQAACNNAENAKEIHVQRLREFQTAIRNLELQQEELRRKAEAVEQRLVTEAAETQQLESQLAEVQAEQEALPPLVAELTEALELETTTYQQQFAVVSEAEALKRHKLQALRRAAELYQERLGLAFEHSSDEGDQLHIVFTQIDPRESERKFQFAVEVQDDSKYAVHSCKPAVESMGGLLETLNAGGQDFSGFVRAVRREFKEMVQREMADC